MPPPAAKPPLPPLPPFVPFLLSKLPWPPLPPMAKLPLKMSFFRVTLPPATYKPPPNAAAPTPPIPRLPSPEGALSPLPALAMLDRTVTPLSFSVPELKTAPPSAPTVGAPCTKPPCNVRFSRVNDPPLATSNRRNGVEGAAVRTRTSLLPTIVILPVINGKASSVELYPDVKPKLAPACNVIVVGVPELLALLMAAISPAVLLTMPPEGSVRSSRASRVKRVRVLAGRQRRRSCRGACPIQRCHRSLNHMGSRLC